jgi:hypothetical protein
MTGVFISYRQSDSKAWALLLRDDLAEVFGAESIFLDRDALKAGHWREQIEQGLASCKVTLLLIGRGWLQAVDAQGRRLDDPDDVHRNEVARALQRPGITVIPVLLDDAPMPTAAELPQDIRALAEYQARRLSDMAERREVDVRALAADIERLAGLRRRQPAMAGGAAQEHYLPFALDEAGARDAFAKWSGNRLLAPGDFAVSARLGTLQAVWVPYWQVLATVTAAWLGRRGQVRKAVAQPASAPGSEVQPAPAAADTVAWTNDHGEMRALIDDIVIPAAELPVSMPSLLVADRLPHVQAASTLPEPPLPVRPVVLAQAGAEVKARQLVHAEIERRVKTQLGGDKQEITQLDLRLEDPFVVRPVLAPAYEGSYIYQGKTEPVWIDAYGGEVGSSSPVAARKVAIVVGAVLLVVAVIAGVVLLMR